MHEQNISAAEKAEQLTDAFRVFNSLSELLVDSYQGLEEQVSKLHQELALAQSERLQNLEEKEKLAGRLEKILAALPAGVIVLNAEGLIIECNAIAETFLAEPLIGQFWTHVFARRLQPVFDNPHERILANGTRVSLNCRQLENEAGQIILLSDVTEMRALQNLLNQQKQLSAMGEMAASMAHQVRTPLATAILYASQMTNPAIDQDVRQRFSEKILERLLHLERQVNDMLSFARRGRMAMSTFSLTALLNHVRVGAQEYARNRQIELQINNQVMQDELLGNAHALTGALMNIVNNAIEAAGQLGCIQINADLVDNNLQLVIQDDGPGIANALCSRIFEPFFTTKSNGTGLGLAVVDSVVRAHGGCVSVASMEGVGAAFTLTLPCLTSAFTSLPGGYSSNAVLNQEMHDETV